MQPPITPVEIAAIISATTEKVFTTMLGLEVQAGPVNAQATLTNEEGKVVCLVGFAGQWSGSGSISCSASLACAISGKLLLADYTAVNDDVLDAMGEMANMIVGNFKDEAAAALGPLSLSTPTVIYGNNFQTRNWNGQSWIAVPFCCEGERFEVKICLVESQALSAQVSSRNSEQETVITQ
jgi:chemotaxis protein CheX